MPHYSRIKNCKVFAHQVELRFKSLLFLRPKQFLKLGRVIEILRLVVSKGKVVTLNAQTVKESVCHAVDFLKQVGRGPAFIAVVVLDVITGF